jgi:hypothetical protein
MPSAQGDSRLSPERCADIRARLAAGMLPLRAPNQKVYAGYGEDQLCDGCGHRIARTDVAYEIELLETSSPTDTLTMHLDCFAVWVSESSSTNEQRSRANRTANAIPGEPD